MIKTLILALMMFCFATYANAQTPVPAHEAPVVTAHPAADAPLIERMTWCDPYATFVVDATTQVEPGALQPSYQGDYAPSTTMMSDHQLAVTKTTQLCAQDMDDFIENIFGPLVPPIPPH